MESQNPSGCNEDQFPGITFQTKNALPQESQILYSWHGLPWPTSKQNALSPGLSASRQSSDGQNEAYEDTKGFSESSKKNMT